MSRKLFPFLLFILIFTNCKKDKVYAVPKELQPYIDSFIAEAKARGINLVIDDLVIIYEKNLNVNGVDAAGVCTFSKKDPHTIKLDTTSGNWQNSLSSREQLIFHELGHCVLNREHTDIKFASDNYKSIMKPTGEQLYGSVAALYKRSYYLDELFNESIPAPSWSNIESPYTTVYSRMAFFTENFDDNSNNWVIGNSTNTIRTIENGIFSFKSLNNGNYIFDRNLEIDQTKDFEIEMGLKFISLGGFAALFYGGSNVSNLFNFYLDKNGNLNLGSLLTGFEYGQTGISVINGQFNKITYRKIGSNCFFYVNGKYLEKQNFIPFYGNKIGIGIGAGPAEINVDYFKVDYLE